MRKDVVTLDCRAVQDLSRSDLQHVLFFEPRPGQVDPPHVGGERRTLIVPPLPTRETPSGPPVLLRV